MEILKVALHIANSLICMTAVLYHQMEKYEALDTENGFFEGTMLLCRVFQKARSKDRENRPAEHFELLALPLGYRSVRLSERREPRIGSKCAP